MKKITNNMILVQDIPIIDTHIRKSRIPYINEENNCMGKSFNNEYNARQWIKRFNKTAKRLNKISYVKILNQFKTIEYKIVGVKINNE